MSRILVAGIEGIDPTKFRKPDEPTSNDMSFLNKPNGCLWGSTLLHDDLYKSDWLRWVDGENFHVELYKNGISFTLYKKARICTVDSLESYLELIREYGILDTMNSMPDYKKYTVDWIELTKHYDAFHLTEDAFWNLRMLPSTITYNDGAFISLKDFYSYDCETWIMFNLECINKGSIMNHNNLI